MDIIVFLKEMSRSAKFMFWNFIYAEPVTYLVNVFICSFLNYTQGSHYKWQDGSFKVIYFSVLIFWSFN